MEYQYFEICIGKGPEESADDFWLCIRGVREPAIQEAEDFCKTEVTRFGGHVLGVYPIEREYAKGCYDFDLEDRWPVFGQAANGNTAPAYLNG